MFVGISKNSNNTLLGEGDPRGARDVATHQEINDREMPTGLGDVPMFAGKELLNWVGILFGVNIYGDAGGSGGATLEGLEGGAGSCDHPGNSGDAISSWECVNGIHNVALRLTVFKATSKKLHASRGTCGCGALVAAPQEELENGKWDVEDIDMVSHLDEASFSHLLVDRHGNEPKAIDDRVEGAGIDIVAHNSLGEGDYHGVAVARVIDIPLVICLEWNRNLVVAGTSPAANMSIDVGVADDADIALREGLLRHRVEVR